MQVAERGSGRLRMPYQKSFFLWGTKLCIEHVIESMKLAGVTDIVIAVSPLE